MSLTFWTIIIGFLIISSINYSIYHFYLIKEKKISNNIYLGIFLLFIFLLLFHKFPNNNI